MKKICSCGGSYRLITKDYTIHTRIENLREIVVKNVQFQQCKICGNTEMSHHSEGLIEELKNHLTQKHFQLETTNY